VAKPETSFVKKPKLGGGKSKKREIPEGLWTKCKRCSTMVFDKELDENLKVCPKCQFHFPIGARERIHSLVETCSFEEMDAEMMSVDVLNFTGVSTYASKLIDYQKSTGQKDAVITGIGKIGEHRLGLGVMDFTFLGGSMGSVVGEKLTRLIEKASFRSRGILGAHPLGGGAEPDPRRAKQLVQAALREHLVAEVDHRCRQEIVHEGDRLPVGKAEPLQADHQRSLWKLERLSDPVARGNDTHVMLNHHDRVTRVDKCIQLRHQLVNVRRMQARRRLIQNVKRVAPLRALQLGSQLDPLRLPA